MIFVNPRPGVKSWFDFGSCEYSSCTMAASVLEADVVLINAGRMRTSQLPQRRPNQIWVMFSKEPPDLPRFDYLARSDLINQVNFSRMIFNDSTWQNKYGGLQKRSLPRKDYNKIFRQKKYDAAWFVSQCSRPSRRMEYVQRMRRSVNVHIYGRCGNLTCGQTGYNMGKKKKECLSLLSRDYKFYLAFENTFCRDYVTEKFFNMFEDVDVIPVVRGGADYKRLFPAGIFIDASDFVSPESLGNYLHDLARDEKRYVAMLQEKNRYIRSGYETNFPCDLCKIAHTGQPRHVYENFYKWLRTPGNCWSPKDLGPVSVFD
ncbi:alpha-(1,3)-fucosyltransferase c-like [Plakobranchus ocellatus]|uniref:Fucosyltransferase n=1 Tax=Plakobranchus ocellatus TaxID=259542 RepID=A0AAV4C2L5_9GAST|nr:alpha-(1,3)-fucosyltransferase c-like [Plakobranchus ocellatus]